MRFSRLSALSVASLLSACFVDRTRYQAGPADSADTGVAEGGPMDVAVDTIVDNDVTDSGVPVDVADVMDTGADPVIPRLISPLSTTNVTTSNVRVVVELPGEQSGTFTVEFNRRSTFDVATAGSVFMDRGMGRRTLSGSIGRMGTDPRGTWFFRACDARAARGTACSAVWSINVLTESMAESKSGHGVAANVLGDDGQDLLVTSRVIQPPSTISHLSRTFYYSAFGSGAIFSTGNLDECTQVHMRMASECATYADGFLLGIFSSILGDANGDGRADVALYGSQGAATMLGTIAIVGGAAAPSLLQRITAEAAVPFAGGATPAGDFNGDGLADMAAIVNAPNGGPTRRRVDVFLASRGATPFSISRRVALPLPAVDSGDIPTPARLTAIGDLNHDGYADIAVRGLNTRDGSGEIWIYAGNADPMMTPVVFGRVSGGGRSNFAMSIAGGGDADNDGIADVFIASGAISGSMSISVLHGSTSAPMISDELPNVIPWSTGAAGIASPGLVTAGDVTGDGLIDAVFVDNLGTVRRIEASTRSSGGVFSLFAPSINVTGSELFSARMIVREVTGDGRGEIIVPVRPTGMGEAGIIRLYSKSPMGMAPSVLEITSPDATGIQFGIDAL